MTFAVSGHVAVAVASAIATALARTYSHFSYYIATAITVSINRSTTITMRPYPNEALSLPPTLSGIVKKHSQQMARCLQVAKAWTQKHLLLSYQVTAGNSAVFSLHACLNLACERSISCSC